MNKHLLAFLVLVLIGVSGLCAQPLVEHVPGDAVWYVGWRGADDLGEGYEGSNLQGLSEATELGEALSQTLDLIERMLRANGRDEDAAVVMGLVRVFWDASWRYPTAVYVQPAADADMPVRVGVIWEVQGEAADRLEAKLNEVVGLLRDEGAPADLVSIRRTDELVSWEAGALDAAELDVVAVGASLAENPEFRQTLTQVNTDGVLVMYADGQGLISLIDQGVEGKGISQEIEMWSKIRNALGLEGLNAAAWSAGFDGKDWRVDLFVDAPAPRTGLLSLLDGDGITDEELEAVPGEATWMLGMRFDLGALLDSVRQGVAEIDPQMSPKLEEALAQGSRMTGVDIEADLIRSLGTAWFAYTDPGAMGSGMMGLCVVNELKDAQKVEQALTALQAIANAVMGQAGGAGGGGGVGGGPEMRVRFYTRTDEGMTLHSLGVPFVSPTWSVYEGRLYVGLYPQTVLAAGERVRAGKGSILLNKKFQAVRARLGVEGASTLVFADLPVTARDAYPNMVMMTQMGTGMLAMFGSDTMPMLVPSYMKVEPYLAPGGQVSWSDDGGYHSRSISPFPGSMMLGLQGGSQATMGAPLAVGVLLPALGAARRAARQMKSVTQCRGIVQAQVMFAVGENQERMSDDIGQLIEGDYFPPEYAISPTSDVSLPRGFHQWDIERQAQWARENASYILIPGLSSDINSRTVSVFERPEHSGGSGMAVGFNDGSARFIDVWEAREMIEAQTGKTLEELIERQRNYQAAVEEPQVPAGP
jgi:hypothetical protein